MSTIIIDIIIFIIVITPLAYFILKSNKDPKSEAALSSFISGDGKQMGELVHLVHCVIALDKDQENIYRFNRADGAIEKVALADLSSCKVEKIVDRGESHDSKTEILRNVTLSMKTKDRKDIKWLVFDRDNQNQIGSDLLDVQALVEKFQDKIKK